MPVEISLTLDNLMVAACIVGAIILISFTFGYVFGKRRKRKEENQGEAAVRKVLTDYCRKSTSHLLNNITLRYKDGTTQIDHILLTQNGILVIETKHYSGWIFAHEKQKSWTQVIFKIKHKFQSPIVQNKKHVSAVRSLLDFMPKEQIQSLVVFTGRAEFKTEIPPNVVHLHQLESFVDGIRFASITHNRLQFCIGRIEYERFEITSQTDVEHQAYLEQKFGVMRQG